MHTLMQKEETERFEAKEDKENFKKESSRRGSKGAMLVCVQGSVLQVHTPLSLSLSLSLSVEVQKRDRRKACHS